MWWIYRPDLVELSRNTKKVVVYLYKHKLLFGLFANVLTSPFVIYH